MEIILQNIIEVEAGLDYYFNSFSLRKWKRYTRVGKIYLSLLVDGKGVVKIVGLDPGRKILKEIDVNGKKDIKYEIDKFDYRLIIIETEGATRKVAGAVIGEISHPNQVKIAIAMTTYRREEFAKKNVGIITNWARGRENEVKLIVVDNGETLKKSELKGAKLIPNENSGGSGGYARGMLAAKKMGATHVILVDDDVEIIPECLHRTVSILKGLRKRYQGRFISGAMLSLDNRTRRFEDIGKISTGRNYYYLGPARSSCELSLLENVVAGEVELKDKKNLYAGWWFCGIPMTRIKKYGLPMPMFLKGDDVEYALRCKANFITMNGIAVWHKDFEAKYNNYTNLYLQHRNILVANAVLDGIDGLRIMPSLEREFRIEMIKFNYKGAQAIIRAVRDYLEGPDFLLSKNGAKLMREYADLNEEITPGDKDLVKHGGLGALKKIFMIFTWNGQRWVRGGNKTAVVERGWKLCAGEIFMKKKIIAVNESGRVVRMRDRKKFQKLRHEWKEIQQEYYRKNGKIEKAFRERRRELIEWKELKD